MEFRGKFAFVVGSVQVVFIVIFAFFVEYDVDVDASNPIHSRDPDKGGQASRENSVVSYYGLFQDVHAMIFFGIGFLLTFLKKYGYTGVGINMLLAAISIQWAIITRNCWHLINGKIRLNIISLIYGDFAAASALIALGGVFGKVSPLQMVIFTLAEVALYTANEHFCITILKIADLGEAVSLHLFSALFGLSVAFVVDLKKEVKGNPNESASYTSNLFCMIGSVFLWALWPSFNSSLATGDDQHRSAINTFLALLASCVTTFVISSLMGSKDKFSMVHVQNATLAGGVAIGTATDMMIQPFGALSIGAIAGSLSVAGYVYVTPFLAKYFKVYDPCGISSLHALPGAFAGLIGGIIAMFASEKDYGYSLYVLYPAMAPRANTTALALIQSELSTVVAGDGRSPLEQAGFQMIYIASTIVIAIITGLITGLLMRIPFFDPLTGDQMYVDEEFWEMPQEENTKGKSSDNNHVIITKF